uniref:Uncharacterized protein n=1 Tax=Rhinopithecus roxellana TaxID=61622 RepID=A0A2K6RBW0_RHIRO
VILPLHSSLGNGARPCLYKIKVKHANHCPTNTPVQIPAFDPREADCWGRLRVLEAPLAVSGPERSRKVPASRDPPASAFQSARITGVSHCARPQPTSFRWLWFGYHLSSLKFMLRFKPQCGRCWDVGPDRSYVI